MFGQVLKSQITVWNREVGRTNQPNYSGSAPKEKNSLKKWYTVRYGELQKKNTTRSLLVFRFFIYRRFVPQFKKRMSTNENCFYNQCNIVVKKNEIINSHES